MMSRSSLGEANSGRFVHPRVNDAVPRLNHSVDAFFVGPESPLEYHRNALTLASIDSRKLAHGCSTVREKKTGPPTGDAGVKVFPHSRPCRYFQGLSTK